MRRNIILLVLLFLLGACSPVSEIEENTPVVDLAIETSTPVPATQTPVPAPSLTPTAESAQCLGDFDEFAYEVVYHYQDYTNFGTTAYPFPPWEFVWELPDNGTYSYLSFVVEYNDMLEIWIQRVRNDIWHTNKTTEYIIYYPETNERIVIPSQIEDTDFWVVDITVAEDGAIWGRTSWDISEEYDIDTLPTLCRFNRENNQFEFDNNSFHYPVRNVNSGLERILERIDYWHEKNGFIWFFVPYDGLYSYVPDSGESNKHLDFPESKVFYHTFAMDGNLYFMLWPDMSDESDKFDELRTIYKFDPETNDVVVFAEVEHLFNNNGGFEMFMDYENQLWLGSVSKIDSMGQQTILYPDYHEFMKKIQTPIGEYLLPPEMIYESSNGYHWFIKNYIERGTAWYDPKTGEGCWFTTFAGGVYEDQDHQVWFLAGNKLYKYSLVD